MSAPTGVEPVLGGRMLGAPVDLQDPSPDLLDGPCGICDMEACTSVATVSWDSAPEFADGRDEVTIGRGCLWAAVDYAQGRVSDRGGITVELPVWRAPQACETAGVSYRQGDYWVREGLVVCEEDARPGSGYQRVLLADQVLRLRRLGELTAVGMPPRVAAALMDADGELAAQVVTALDAHLPLTAVA